MTEGKANLEGNVSDSYREVSREMQDFCRPMTTEIGKYCQALAAYNQLQGKDNPEQAAATTTGLLIMSELLDKLQHQGHGFAYVMAETLFRDYAKKEAGWTDDQLEAYFKKVEDNQKEGGK